MEGLQWLNGGRLKWDPTVGAIVNNELCLMPFDSSTTRKGAMDLFSLDTLTRRTATVCDTSDCGYAFAFDRATATCICQRMSDKNPILSCKLGMNCA